MSDHPDCLTKTAGIAAVLFLALILSLDLVLELDSGQRSGSWPRTVCPSTGRTVDLSFRHSARRFVSEQTVPGLTSLALGRVQLWVLCPDLAVGPVHWVSGFSTTCQPVDEPAFDVIDDVNQQHGAIPRRKTRLKSDST